MSKDQAKRPDPVKTNEASKKVMRFLNAIANTFNKRSEGGGNTTVVFNMDNGNQIIWIKDPIKPKEHKK